MYSCVLNLRGETLLPKTSYEAGRKEMPLNHIWQSCVNTTALHILDLILALFEWFLCTDFYFIGGIRRRLRDRDLLRKRKAEAEEKETNQWVFG